MTGIGRKDQEVNVIVMKEIQRWQVVPGNMPINRKHGTLAGFPNEPSH